MWLGLLLAATAAQPAEVPVTSSSPQAVQLFRAGRDKAINFQDKAAVELLKKALALDPGFALALAWLGRETPGPDGQAMLEKAAQLSAALPVAERKSVEELLADRKGEDERVRTLLREIADLAPGDWVAQFELGVQSFYDHKSQAAILYMTRTLALNPNAADAYNYRGNTLASLGQYDDAIRDLQKFVELQPKEPNSYDSYGEVLLMAGKYDEAEKNFARAAQMSPDSWMSFVGVAYTRFFRGNFNGGRKALQDAKKFITQPEAELAVDLAIAWSWLGEGKSAEALKELDDLEKRARESLDEFRFAWAAFERAEMFDELGRFKEASDQLEVARGRGSVGKLSGAEQNRLRRSSLVLEARIAAAQKQPDSAERAVNELQSDWRKAPSNYDLRGVVHYAQGLVQLARGNWQLAARDFLLCARNDYYCQRDLADAQEKAGQQASANETRARILAANNRDDIHRGVDPIYLYVDLRLRNGR